MPARKRRVVYPPPRTQTRQPRPGEPGGVGGPPAEYVRPTVASINLAASAGRAGLKPGDRVRITGSGLYSGELATIDRLAAGVIPSAVVRTDAGAIPEYGGRIGGEGCRGGGVGHRPMDRQGRARNAST